MLYHDFLTNNQNSMLKGLYYIPIYERHFGKFQNQSVTVFEIGVAKGGSLQMWKRYFGPFATIIGIDINQNCKRYEGEQISICIGDQSDTAFLQSVIDTHGVPDIVIDDGSHQMDHVNATFDFLYNKLSKNGVYLVEDMHCSYWPKYGGGLNKEGTFIERCKCRIDHLNARYNNLDRDFSKSTFSISFYDSVVVFEKWQFPVNSSLAMYNATTNVKELMPQQKLSELTGKLRNRYSTLVYYGFGGWLKYIYSLFEGQPHYGIIPDEIWDKNAQGIDKRDIAYLKDIQVKAPVYDMQDKSNVAIIITIKNEDIALQAKQELQDKGFQQIYFI